MLAGSALTVENCVIGNMPNSSIYVNAPAIVRIMDTTIRATATWACSFAAARAPPSRGARSEDNGNQGFELWGTAGTTTTADIVDSVVDRNGYGVVAYSTDASAVVKISVRNSQLAGNSNHWRASRNPMPGPWSRCR
jgi:hypothetical protein